MKAHFNFIDSNSAINNYYIIVAKLANNDYRRLSP